MRPPPAEIAGVNACAVGTRFTCIGVAGQLWPPSKELESATPLWSPPLNCELSQTTWTVPVEASTAMAGSDPPFRTSFPVLGSVTTVFCTVTTLNGGPGQVTPLSLERRTVMSNCRVLGSLLWVMTNIAFSNVPSGATAMMFPTVCASAPGSNRMRAVSQLFPPSVLRLNQAGPLAVGEFGLLNSVRRSQTAYTSEASFGSAVIDP